MSVYRCCQPRVQYLRCAATARMGPSWRVSKKLYGKHASIVAMVK